MIKRLVWNLDGIGISENVTAEFVYSGNMPSQEVVLRGIGWGQHGQAYDWSATISPNGWVITVEGQRGPEVFRGSTFNLPLEVAAAIRRTL
jgi:hypothetical protein